MFFEKSRKIRQLIEYSIFWIASVCTLDLLQKRNRKHIYIRIIVITL